MSYREVTMVEIKEILRLWLRGTRKRRIAALLGIDPKTVRRYVVAAQGLGLQYGQDESALTEELVASVLSARRAEMGRARGESWALCSEQKPAIAKWLREKVRLSKIRKLLLRQGVDVPYATLRRFAVEELGFGRAAPTIAVADCGPGEEIQLDTGWMTYLGPDLFGKRRRFRAWIFTAVLSRHRFVWPCFRETTESAIEACEEAWAFFGGVFRVLLPDNTKAIVQKADPLEPLINPTFLEYAQARGFVIDPTRSGHPKDKARVERSVPTVRDDCFGGEQLQSIEDARALARHWCTHDYGMRRHTRTQRLPFEHFEAEEKGALLPAPTSRYDTPIRCEPKVARDQYAQVARALYSLPTRFVGKTLHARADSVTVRFYHGSKLIKTHPRQAPGGRSTDPSDFPDEKAPYALRDIAFLQRKAAAHGRSVGHFAKALLEGPLPWTRMRRVYKLLSLARRYGDQRLEDACSTALNAEMIDIRRLERMLQIGAPPPVTPRSPAPVIPLARYLRPASQYRLSLESKNKEGEDE